MNRRKALSLFLALALSLSLVLPTTSALAADDTNDGGDKTKGMSISKTASYNEETGKYTITLEAFATGEQITTVVSRDIPTDIILVLDQSRSMNDPIGQANYTQYTGNDTQNSINFKNRHNGGSANLWYKLPDGSYVSVSVIVQQTLNYTKIESGCNDNTWYYDNGWHSATNYWENKDNLYAYDANGEIKKVVYTRSRESWLDNWDCKYAFEDGTILNENSNGSQYVPTFTNTDDGFLYLGVVDESKNIYTYTYTDSTGAVQTIGTSTGSSTRYTPAFYRRSVDTSLGDKRIVALKNAVTSFAAAVAKKAAGPDGDINTAEDNVNHRIAVVGFASGQYYGYTDYNYANTEVFVGSNQYTYGTDATAQYGNAFQNMNTSTGVNNVNASIGALAADGGTLTNLGLEMANGIFGANPIQSGEKRNRVVVVFTDGAPGWNGYDGDIASSAISQATTAKNIYKATVYGVGIFSGADASSVGSASGDETQQANWFMHQISNNNGTPKSPSYYLSAADAGALNSIFKQISDNIETGGSSTTLGSETVVKDIISPYFKLPEGTELAGIRIDTYDCTGKTGDTYSWNSTSGGNGGATADIGTDGQVNVTGFDFSANWCGLDNGAAHGKKLVISFEVEPKSGFLGGNSVDTNGGAYIYENGEANTPLMEFEKPIVNVPIPALTVGAMDRNVYLLGNVTADEIRSGVTVSVGSVALNLDPNVSNYGLADWQTKYVDINITYKDAAGNVLTDWTGLTDDTTYSVEVTVTPKPVTAATDIGPTATEAKGSASGSIYVFKPELTYKDSEAYYGETVAADFSGNLVANSEKWMHGTTDSTTVTMLGDKPKLSFAYTHDISKIADGKYTKQDVPVSAKVSIGTTDVTGHTTIRHQPCDGKTCALSGGYHFWVHIKTCTLTITKINGADDETYVFDVLKNNVKYSEVTIRGNNSQTLIELPVGNYTITEDTGWSWRYAPTYGGYGNLSAGHSEGELTCTNKKGPDEWLNGYSDVTRNIYGFGTTTTANGNN